MPKRILETVKWEVRYTDEEGRECSSIAYDDDQLILIIDMLLIYNADRIVINKNKEREGFLWR